MGASLNDYLAAGDAVSIPDGAVVFAPGDDGQAFLIVTQGAVRVEQTNGAGRTVVLYRVEPGESCVLTTMCLLSGRAYPGFGHAEGEVRAVAIAPATFQKMLREDPDFQQIVIDSFATRVGELTGVIDDLLEHRTDMRLARWLSTRPNPDIMMKQAEIAQELGTAREVVSRALKAFEARGWVAIERGKVRLIDAAALKDHGKSTSV